MSAATNVLTLDQIIVEMIPAVKKIPVSTKPAPTLNQIIAKQAKLQGRTQEQLKRIVTEVAAGYDAFDPLFLFALRTKWMLKASEPVIVLEVSPELKHDPEREASLRRAFKAELSRDNPWRDELPIKPFWYLLGGLDWTAEALFEFSESVAKMQAKRANNGYVLAVAATKNPIIEPSGLPPYRPTKKQLRRMREKCHPWCKYDAQRPRPNIDYEFASRSNTLKRVAVEGTMPRDGGAIAEIPPAFVPDRYPYCQD